MSDVILSTEMLQAMAAQETAEVIVALLTIEHSDLAGPLRISSDPTGTTSNGEDYTFFPYRIRLPSNEENTPPEMQLEVDNVDRVIIRTLRTISSAATVGLQIVRASDPDTVEFEANDFTLRNCEGNSMTVSGSLTREVFTNEPYPAGRFTPFLFPGLYK